MRGLLVSLAAQGLWSMVCLSPSYWALTIWRARFQLPWCTNDSTLNEPISNSLAGIARCTRCGNFFVRTSIVSAWRSKGKLNSSNNSANSPTTRSRARMRSKPLSVASTRYHFSQSSPGLTSRMASSSTVRRLPKDRDRESSRASEGRRDEGFRSCVGAPAPSRKWSVG
eukprot:7325065-Prymnesium_polylepis.1